MGLQFCVGSLASARHANPCGGEGGEEGLARGGKGGEGQREEILVQGPGKEPAKGPEIRRKEGEGGKEGKQVESCETAVGELEPGEVVQR